MVPPSSELGLFGPSTGDHQESPSGEVMNGLPADGVFWKLGESDFFHWLLLAVKSHAPCPF